MASMNANERRTERSRFSLTKRAALIVGGGAAVIAVGFLLKWRDVNGGATLAFLGYTNFENASVAAFTLSNGADRAFLYEVTNRVEVGSNIFRVVEPRQTSVFYVVSPATAETWRLSVSYRFTVKRPLLERFWDGDSSDKDRLVFDRRLSSSHATSIEVKPPTGRSASP